MNLQDFTQKIWTQRLFTNLTEELNLIECGFETAQLDSDKFLFRLIVESIRDGRRIEDTIDFHVFSEARSIRSRDSLTARKHYHQSDRSVAQDL